MSGRAIQTYTCDRGELCFEWPGDPEMLRKVFMSDAHDLVKDKIKGVQIGLLKFHSIEILHFFYVIISIKMFIALCRVIQFCTDLIGNSFVVYEFLPDAVKILCSFVIPYNLPIGLGWV